MEWNCPSLPRFVECTDVRKSIGNLNFTCKQLEFTYYLCHHADLMCNALPAPDNGRIVYSPDTTSPYSFATTATYICNSGYGLSGGTRTRNCGGDDSSPIGSWDGSAPLCIGKGALNTITFY